MFGRALRMSLVFALALVVAAPAAVSAIQQQGPKRPPVRVGGDIKEPKKIKDVKPVYPEEAQRAGVQGIVIIETVIGTDGTVQQAQVLRPVPILDKAALDAVMQWRYTPTLLNGEPVEVIMTVTVTFSLTE
ncbi:MAG TPA: energy transducer TonB [Vicinamibacterales bacterium]|nr:energy transducer TonB [Vicinamibacterales bacterium]